MGVNFNQLPKILKPTYIAWWLSKLNLRSSITDPKLLIQSSQYNEQFLCLQRIFINWTDVVLPTIMCHVISR